MFLYIEVCKPHEYGKVILPITVIKCFDYVLVDTKESVLKKMVVIYMKKEENH